MKKIILILFIFLTMFCVGSDTVQGRTNLNVEDKIEIVQDNGQLYRDLGSYTFNYADSTYIQIYAYIWKRPNTSGYYPKYGNEFILIAVSESNNGVRTTETWLYNNKVFLNDKEISKNQYPFGMTTYVNTSPTSIYTWFTNDNDIGEFTMEWNSSVYENR